MFLISFKLVMFTLIVINTVFDVCSAAWVRTSNHQLCVLSVIHHVWLIGGMRGVPGEPRFKLRTFFFPTLTTAPVCCPPFALAEIYFTYVQIFGIYSLKDTKIRINISCMHVALDSSLICDTHVQTVFPCVFVDLHIDPLLTKSFLPSSTNSFSVLKPEIISWVSCIVQCS